MFCGILNYFIELGDKNWTLKFLFLYFKTFYLLSEFRKNSRENYFPATSIKTIFINNSQISFNVYSFNLYKHIFIQYTKISKLNFPHKQI